MVRPILYFGTWSPPSCAVRMTAKAIRLDFDLREINLLKRDHLKDDYLKINPQRTIPVFKEDDFIISDSHAIMGYIVDKYADNDNLYPKDLKKRAIVNQRLHYSGGVLFSGLLGALKPLLRGKTKTVSLESLQFLEASYKYLNTILDGRKWLAGDSYTLADFSTITALSSVTVFKSINDYPNLINWMKNCQELPGYSDIAAVGIKEFHDIVNQRLEK